VLENAGGLLSWVRVRLIDDDDDLIMPAFKVLFA